MQKMSRTLTFTSPPSPPRAKNKPTHFSASRCPWNRPVGGGVDGRLISQTYSLSPAPYLPTGIATFPFLIIMNDSALPPLLPPSLHSSVPHSSCGDVINHVDTLLVLILRVPSFSRSLSPSSPYTLYLRLLQCLSISLALRLINHLFAL